MFIFGKKSQNSELQTVEITTKYHAWVVYVDKGEKSIEALKEAYCLQQDVELKSSKIVDNTEGGYLELVVYQGHKEVISHFRLNHYYLFMRSGAVEWYTKEAFESAVKRGSFTIIGGK